MGSEWSSAHSRVLRSRSACQSRVGAVDSCRSCRQPGAMGCVALAEGGERALEWRQVRGREWRRGRGRGGRGGRVCYVRKWLKELSAVGSRKFEARRASLPLNCGSSRDCSKPLRPRPRLSLRLLLPSLPPRPRPPDVLRCPTSSQHSSQHTPPMSVISFSPARCPIRLQALG